MSDSKTQQHPKILQLKDRVKEWKERGELDTLDESIVRRSLTCIDWLNKQNLDFVEQLDAVPMLDRGIEIRICMKSGLKIYLRFLNDFDDHLEVSRNSEKIFKSIFDTKEIIQDLLIFEKTYTLIAKGLFDGAIDVLFDLFDDLLLQSQSVRCDYILRTIDLKRLDTNLIVTVLSITLKASEPLPSRPEFYRKAEKRLIELAPDRVELLLKGLQ